MADTAENKNPGDENPSGIAGFGALSENDFMDIESVDNKEQVKAEDKNPPAEKKEDKTDPAEKKEEVKIEEKKPAAEEKVVDKKDEKMEEEEEAGFKTEGATLTNKEEEEAKWSDIAKEIGFELKEDSYESFVEGQKLFIENLSSLKIPAQGQENSHKRNWN